MRFPLASLRSRAIGLVLLAILPVLALTLSSYLHQRDREIREVQKDALTAAKNLAVIQEIMISSTKRLLMTLSQMPEVQKFDRAGSNALFARMLEENPYYNAIIAVDPQGQLFASAPPAHAPSNFRDRFWFKRVLQTNTFSIGELVKGRLTGRYAFDLAYPIANRQGDLQGVILVGTNLEWWGNLLTQMGFTPDTAMVFSDSSQKVLYRYPDPEKYVGRELPEALIKAMALGNAGVASGVGLPGDPRLFAFARLAPPWQEMWVSIGLPKDVAVAPAKQAMKRNLVFLFLVAFLALAAAWYFGEYFVFRPVQGLLGVTKRLAAGDLRVRAGAAYQKGELGLLASSFDHMAASLHKRDAALEEQRRRLMQAVEDLRESEERLRLAQEAAQVGIWDWQPQNQILQWTPELAELYGIQPDTVKNYQDWSSLVHPEDLPRLEAERDAAIAGHLPFNLEFRIFHSSGQTRWLQAMGGALYDDDGHPLRVFGVNIDITERKQMEKALQDSETRFRLAQKAAKIGTFEWNIQTGVNTWTLEMEELYGLPPGGFAKTQVAWENLLYPDDRPEALRLVERAFETGETVEGEWRVVWPDGSIHWLAGRWQVFYGKSGQPSSMTGINIDITIRKQAEEALRQLNEELENRVAVRTGELNQEKQNLRHLAAKLITAQEEERGRLSRDLHDDFGQSLLVLSMQLNAILKRNTLAPETREQFEKAVSYLLEVTNKVRRFSQNLSPPSLEQLGPTEALRELFEEFQEYHDNLIISADLDEVKDILPLEADITIYRIAQEFLTNAHKHANATQVAMAMKVLPGKVTVSLKDNGRGFDLQEIKNRPKDKRGLGLASIEERLKMIGSQFRLTSRPGSGTSLYFEILRPPAEKPSEILAF